MIHREQILAAPQIGSHCLNDETGIHFIFMQFGPWNDNHLQTFTFNVMFTFNVRVAANSQAPPAAAAAFRRPGSRKLAIDAAPYQHRDLRTLSTRNPIQHQAITCPWESVGRQRTRARTEVTRKGARAAETC
jgi:hypothetical protein